MTVPQPQTFREDFLTQEENRVHDLRVGDSIGCVSSSDFLMACGPARNTNAVTIETLAVEITERLELLSSINRRRFDAFNSIVGYTYPTASVARGLVNAQWSNWLFFFDDVYDEDFERAKDLARVAGNIEHHIDILRNGGQDLGATPLERLTIDLHQRLLGLGGSRWLERFCSSVADYLQKGVLRAVENWAWDRTPSLDVYLLQREYDCSMHACIDMIEIAEAIEIPDWIRDLPAMQRARRACARTVGYFNDIVSYPKEVLISRNPNNLVHVLVNDKKMPLQEAVLCATEMVNQCTQDLLTAEADLRGLPAEHSVAIDTYIQGMKHWQRGNVDWSLEGNRYASPWSPLVELVRPAIQDSLT